MSVTVDTFCKTIWLLLRRQIEVSFRLPNVCSEAFFVFFARV